MFEQNLMVGAGQRLEVSSSSDNDEGFCPEEIQRLLLIKQSLTTDLENLELWGRDWNAPSQLQTESIKTTGV